MIEIGRRARAQAPAPHVVFEALTEPNRDPARQWMALLEDEQWPHVTVLEAERVVTWSRMWTARPDAVVRFELSRHHQGTSLLWVLSTDEPAPSPALIGHLRTRVNVLINADLRYSFGQ